MSNIKSVPSNACLLRPLSSHPLISFSIPTNVLHTLFEIWQFAITFPYNVFIDIGTMHPEMDANPDKRDISSRLQWSRLERESNVNFNASKTTPSTESYFVNAPDDNQEFKMGWRVLLILHKIISPNHICMPDISIKGT